MMKKIRSKNGSVAVTYPLVIFVSIFFVIMAGIFLINSIFPFIWYQKLNSTAQKYMFVVEKFGYLTSVEKVNLLNELNSQGFDTNKIKIEAPSSKKSYGQLIEFKISYKYNYKNISGLKLENKAINLIVTKSSYSKV